jgi:regulator of protease activity HflC (stomatin/prohibitin superfamily)
MRTVFWPQILERCGAFTGILQPGLNFIVPCIDVPSNPISMRLQQIEVSCETKTKDNVFTQMKARTRRRAIRPPRARPLTAGRACSRGLAGLDPVPDCQGGR